MSSTSIEEQFIEMYRAYAPKILKYCWVRVRSREDAEDLVAKVFAKTWDHLAQGGRIDYLKAFLYRVARNQIIDYYRTSKKDHEVSMDSFGEDTVDIPDDTHVESDLEMKSLMSEVAGALKKLPEQYAEIITLRYLNELDIEEIASITGMSRNNVSVKLHRAIERLKKEL